MVDLVVYQMTSTKRLFADKGQGQGQYRRLRHPLRSLVGSRDDTSRTSHDELSPVQWLTSQLPTCPFWGTP